MKLQGVTACVAGVLLVLSLGCGGGSGESSNQDANAQTGDTSQQYDTTQPGDTNQPQPDGTQNTPALLNESHLKLEGSFRVPNGDFGSPQWTGFNYGGTALAYHAANKSLYLVGHDHHQMVAEISIPTIVKSDKLGELNTATVLQEFVEITGGKLSSVDDGSVKIGGLLVFDGKLYGTAYSYYDADGNQSASSFFHSLTLTEGSSFDGFHTVGALGAGLVSGFMTAIPAEWQDKFGGPALIGQCCIPIISRTSYGPSAFVFNPADIGSKDPVETTPLVYYPAENPLSEWGETSPLFNGSTTMGGVVFPRGSRSVLFIGRQGTGEFCYGTGEDCSDPTDSSKGNHAYPYRTQVWAYDVDELLSVKSGQKKPWEVKPYKTWELTLPFAQGGRVIYGVAYDPENQRIFLSQRNSDGDLPLIQVLKVVLP